ncbi:MAG: hypothetical protein ACK41D_06800 [Rubricoccaceae bacterium]
MFRPRSLLLVVLVLLVAASGCAPSHRLRDVSLEDRRVAVAAAVPPHPRVQAGSPEEAAVNPFDPVGSAIRVGTAASKYREARRAQARLDSAVARVDVSDRIARQVLVRSASALRFQPGDRPSTSDYVIDLRVYDYSLVASSFEGATYFVLLGDVYLLDARTGRRLWHTRLREREILDASLFRLPATAGNVITARALAGLSEADLSVGLQRLADFTAQRIVERFQRDYLRSRGAYARRHRAR